ncbi:MAG: hypothetical protein E6J88_03720 [Deltaproteobacteria bacterium]|nr:MAG: hypothetical protein E6J88_03720 [Deltaproteobacteria bacterium]
MRTPALLLLRVPSVAYADLVDASERRAGRPSSWVVRAEGGSAFAPYGYAGGALSWLTESGFAFEAGAGGGFPGLQLGLAARRLFGEGGSYLVTEIALAGNTRVNRGASEAERSFGGASLTRSSLWTDIGFGFEQRQDTLDVSVVGCIVFTTSSLTPQWAIHGGVGFGF